MNAVVGAGKFGLRHASNEVRVKSASREILRKAKGRKAVALTAAQRRTTRQFLAAIAAGFLPIASYTLLHREAPSRTWLYGLVAAALLFSAPTLAEWAQLWCRSKIKAWGFTVLLEGVMAFSNNTWLNVTGLVILVAINSAYAWENAKKPH